MYSNGNRLPLSDQHNQPLSTGYAGIEQIAPQHGVVLGQDRDNDRWIFGPLALVDRHGIGWHERIEFAEAIGDIAAIESDNQFTRVLVDVIDVANVAIVDLLS